MDEIQQTAPPPQYPDGSRVLCADGQTLGEVVATFREYLIVERGYFFPTDFYVPYAAIAEAGGGDIVLSLNGHDALARGWHTPPEDPIVPEAPPPPEPVPVTPPPTAKPATTAAPDIEAAPAAPDSDEAAPEAQTQPTTPEPGPVVEATEPETAPVEAETATVVEPSAPEPPPQSDAVAQAEPTTTAAPAVPVEESVEVQSFQPDASVPPPAEPEETGTVNLAPSFVGIPGRRLTDAELWSLLEPKDGPAESDDDSGDQTKNVPDEDDRSQKPPS